MDQSWVANSKWQKAHQMSTLDLKTLSRVSKGIGLANQALNLLGKANDIHRMR